VTEGIAAMFGRQPTYSGLPGPDSTPELRRILSIPLRDPEPLAAQLAAPLTTMLKTPAGTMSLRPIQALALAEAHDHRGLLALIGVGLGKTLISYLLPAVLKPRSPLLIVPAALMHKTTRDFADLAQHWSAPPPQVSSYEWISRNPEGLETLAPDLLIFDEVHGLKDPQAACTRRVRRYMQAKPSTTVCAMSGTLTARSFMDWWHIQRWCLRPEFQPLPYAWPEVQSWCEALDEKLKQRRPPGALVEFGAKDATGIRQAYGQRLRQIPSVVASQSTGVDCSLRIDVKRLSVPEVDQHVADMRRTWALPTGEDFFEAVDLWRHAREMANGFFYLWDPPPPEDWRFARSEAMRLVRHVLKHSRTYDTPTQVLDAYAGDPLIQAWRALEPTYTPNTVAQWFTQAVLTYAIEWSQRYEGIVWVEHTTVGERLEALGLPYYGRDGRRSNGQSIVDASGPIAASQAACSKGFNLQRYARNLVLNATPLGTRWEQLIGRTHRTGQQADCVHVEVLCTVEEQREGFEQACRDARYEQQISGHAMKLCLADVTQHER
jgi:hypothetical protein